MSSILVNSLLITYYLLYYITNSLYTLYLTKLHTCSCTNKNKDIKTLLTLNIILISFPILYLILVLVANLIMPNILKLIFIMYRVIMTLLIGTYLLYILIFIVSTKLDVESCTCDSKNKKLLKDLNQILIPYTIILFIFYMLYVVIYMYSLYKKLYT